MYVDIANEARNRRIGNGKLNRKGWWERDDWSKKKNDKQADKVALQDTVNDALVGTDPIVTFGEMADLEFAYGQVVDLGANMHSYKEDDETGTITIRDGQIVGFSFGIEPRETTTTTETIGRQVLIPTADPNSPRQKQLQSRKPLYC